MQPDVIFFSDAGPGVRWVGNERGIAGETNWCAITPDTLYAGKPGIEKLLNEGSENGTEWIPAEVDVSIRPGWFYHANEDNLVKSPEKLFDIYLTSVGRGAVLLLNIPPDKNGLIHQNDVLSLKGFRQLLDSTFKTSLAAGITVTASSVRGNDPAYTPMHLTDDNKESYWATDDGITSASITFDLEKPMKIKYIVLQEYIKLGQRVKRFSIEVLYEGNWKEVAEKTTIGYKRIIQIDPVIAQKVRVNILESRACPVISTIALF
jgi:alpha-L-fucosidase